MHAVRDGEADAGNRTVAEMLLAENTQLEAQLDGLHRALQSRASIEQAKGVLIAFTGCTEAQAFDLLVRLSQNRNVRLRVLAEVLLRVTAVDPAEPDEDGLHSWLRDELVRLGQQHRRSPGKAGEGRPRGR